MHAAIETIVAAVADAFIGASIAKRRSAALDKKE
jgi:hypothetical protein